MEEALSTTIKIGEEEEDSSKFTPKNSRRLTELLSVLSIPGVSRENHMNLLSVIDTWRQAEELKGGFDECGKRFLLSAKMTEFMKNSSSKTHMDASNWAWALHSDAQETILSTCFSQNHGWQQAKSLGLVFWIKNPLTLKKIGEQIAKVEYVKKKDPVDCSLFYLALKRKPVLISMYKSSKNAKIAEFFENDFSIEKK